jgi:hypothetical protein
MLLVMWKMRSTCVKKYFTVGPTGEKVWKPLCEHVKKLENEYYDRDASFDIAIDRIIISLGGLESYNSDSSEDDSSTDTGRNAWHRITHREQRMTAESSSLNVFGYTIHAQTDSWPSCSPLTLCIFSLLTVTFPKLAVIVRPLYSADIFDAGWMAGEVGGWASVE